MCTSKCTDDNPHLLSFRYNGLLWKIWGREEEMSLICSRICLLNGEVACSCSYLFSKLKLMDDELIWDEEDLSTINR